VPYYIFQTYAFPIRRLELVAEETVFREASARTKALRASPDLPPGCVVKMVFAENQLHAEDLLNQVRTPQPGVVGDE
jgi:hypothetical protein